MANNFDNPWGANPWAKGGEYYDKSAVGTGTQYLPDGFLDTTESLQEWKAKREQDKSDSKAPKNNVNPGLATPPPENTDENGQSKPWKNDDIWTDPKTGKSQYFQDGAWYEIIDGVEVTTTKKEKNTENEEAVNDYLRKVLDSRDPNDPNSVLYSIALKNSLQSNNSKYLPLQANIPMRRIDEQGNLTDWKDGDIWVDEKTGIEYVTYNGEWGISLDKVTIIAKESTSSNVTLDRVLEEMKSLVNRNIPYSQQGDRQTLTERGLAELDCSETVSIYLKKLGIMNSNRYSLSTMSMLNEKDFRKAVGSDRIEFVKGSNLIGFTPQKGDIFVWRTNRGGHTGIVYQVAGDKITILEAIGKSGSSDESFNTNNGGTSLKGVSRTAVYQKSGAALSRHVGWVGYYRPIIKFENENK